MNDRPILSYFISDCTGLPDAIEGFHCKQTITFIKIYAIKIREATSTKYASFANIGAVQMCRTAAAAEESS